MRAVSDGGERSDRGGGIREREREGRRQQGGLEGLVAGDYQSVSESVARVRVVFKLRREEGRE